VVLSVISNSLNFQQDSEDNEYLFVW
jgi:hypothetical protein